MSTNRESEAGRRGLFAIFFAFSVPFAFFGLFLSGKMSYSLWVHGPESNSLGSSCFFAVCTFLLGYAAFGACFASLLAAGKWEGRLVLILWVAVVLAAGALMATLFV